MPSFIRSQRRKSDKSLAKISMKKSWEISSTSSFLSLGKYHRKDQTRTKQLWSWSWRRREEEEETSFCFYFCLCCRNGAGTWNIYKFVRIGPRLCLGSSPVVAFVHRVNLDCLKKVCWNLLCLCKVVGIQKLELGKFREVKSRTIAVSKGIKLKT